MNYTGAGGAAKGTVYAVIPPGGNESFVARFEPKAGGLKFVERWQVLSEGLEDQRKKLALPPYEICGPATVTESVTGEPKYSIFSEAGAGNIGVVLEMKGGKRGLLENSTNICRGSHRAEVEFNAQNGEVQSFRAPIPASCGGGDKGRGKKK